MISTLIVISWWSNCLGLKCIEKLKMFLPGRKIIVLQVGKQHAIKEKFSKSLPPDVEEIIYPKNEICSHWRVIEVVVKTILKESEGLWFFDHDVFLMQNATSWLNKMDDILGNSNVSMCLPSYNETHRSGTSPAFWISPVRLPQDTPCFSPLPLKEDQIAKKPFDRYPLHIKLNVPQYDTLMKAAEYLERSNLVSYFDPNSQDLAFNHLGNLNLFAFKNLPDNLKEFFHELNQKYRKFYSDLPPELLNSEDRILLDTIMDTDHTCLNKNIPTV